MIMKLYLTACEDEADQPVRKHGQKYKQSSR